MRARRARRHSPRRRRAARSTPSRSDGVRPRSPTTTRPPRPGGAEATHERSCAMQIRAQSARARAARRAQAARAAAAGAAPSSASGSVVRTRAAADRPARPAPRSRARPRDAGRGAIDSGGARAGSCSRSADHPSAAPVGQTQRHAAEAGPNGRARDATRARGRRMARSRDVPDGDARTAKEPRADATRSRSTCRCPTWRTLSTFGLHPGPVGLRISPQLGLAASQLVARHERKGEYARSTCAVSPESSLRKVRSCQTLPASTRRRGAAPSRARRHGA